MPADGVAFHPVVGDAHDVTMAPVICEYEAGAVVSGGTRSEAAQHFIFVVAARSSSPGRTTSR